MRTKILLVSLGSLLLAACESRSPLAPAQLPVVGGSTEAARAVQVSGFHSGDLVLSVPTELSGDFDVGGNLTLVSGATINPKGHALTVHGHTTINAGASLIMKHATSNVTVYAGIFMGGSNTTDSTLISAGTIDFAGGASGSNVGGIPLTSGSSTIMITGDSLDFTGTSLANLWVNAPTLAKIHAPGGAAIEVKRTLDVSHGEARGDFIVRRRIHMGPGTTIGELSNVTAYGALDLGGTFAPNRTRFRQGLSYTIPTGPTINYHQVYIENGTAARFAGNTSAHDILIEENSTLSLGNDTVSVTNLVSGDLRMHSPLGLLTSGAATLAVPTAADSTRLSAGTVKLVGSGGTIPYASGVFRAVLAGTAAQQFQATRIPRLEIANATNVTLYNPEVTRLLNVVAGELKGSGVVSVKGKFRSAPSTTVSVAELRLEGDIAIEGTFKPGIVRFLRPGPVVIPSGTNFQYQTIRVGPSTNARIGANVSLANTLTVEAGGSLAVGPYTLTTPADVIALGALVMHNGRGVVDAGRVMTSTANDLDETLLSAGTIHVTGDYNAVGRSSGTHRIVLAGNSSTQLHGTSLQHVEIDRSASVEFYVPTVKGHLWLQNGILNTHPALVVDRLRLEAGTTLGTGSGIRYVSLFRNNGATINGAMPALF